MAEVAAVAVRAVTAGAHHAAELGLKSWVADHRAELVDPVGEPAAVGIWAASSLPPFVAKLRLGCPLLVHLHLHFT